MQKCHIRKMIKKLVTSLCLLLSAVSLGMSKEEEEIFGSLKPINEVYLSGQAMVVDPTHTNSDAQLPLPDGTFWSPSAMDVQAEKRNQETSYSSAASAASASDVQSAARSGDCQEKDYKKRLEKHHKINGNRIRIQPREDEDEEYQDSCSKKMQTKFPCPFLKCPEIYAHYTSLNYHIKKHHCKPKNALKCSMCRASYAENIGFKAHEKKHQAFLNKTGEEAVQSQVNQNGSGGAKPKDDMMKTRAQQSSESAAAGISGKRKRSSGGDGIFKCDHSGCGKSFSQKQVLGRHIRDVHQDIRKFKCEICPDRSFNQRSHLERHLKTHRHYSASLVASKGSSASSNNLTASAAASDDTSQNQHVQQAPVYPSNATVHHAAPAQPRLMCDALAVLHAAAACASSASDNTEQSQVK